ncbi:hypothetical protein [Paenibacillus sp. DMB5]|uniref:hypothetical protein n=1 Tax=Paenibacillus sp. DMB5 TaxID=1780103 RepID=UPI00076C0DC4|nr:hypothetical protein [Paenibacillus sp. DMB5]KUP23115.1 hypothetical protein AWJ19_22830 [Paenibacillus sp. DMB5]
MKKYIFGFLVGAIFTVSTTAFADDIKSLVGKAIQGEAPVIVDGQQLDTAIIVDGKSYAPVRVIGEAAGYSVSVDGKKIILKSEVKDTMKTTSENLDKPRTLEDVTTVITRTQEKIERYKEAIQLYELNAQPPRRKRPRRTISKCLIRIKSSSPKLNRNWLTWRNKRQSWKVNNM